MLFCVVPRWTGGAVVLHTAAVWVVAVALALGAGVATARAQGTVDPTVLRTGGGLPLVSSSQSFQIASNALPAELAFEFGFGTDEVVSPGAILDAFTVTVQDAAMAHTLVLLTADASGVVWAPPTPGGVVISPGVVVRQPIAFPSLQPVLAHQSAFAVTVPLPSVFVGPVNVYFDLFDNLNGTASLGWYRGAVIPEPGTWVLLVVGGLLVWRWKRSRP